MKATERYGFPYPEPEDFGDGSTQLAYLADAVDDQLQQQIDDYNLLLRPETYIRSRVTGINFAMSTLYGTITWDNEVYSSSGINAATTNVLSVSTPGIYHAGMFVWLSAVGATTLNSSREFMLEFVDRRGPSLADQVNLQWEQTTLEAATGVAVTMYATFPVYTPTYPAGGLRGYLRHQNAGSQMQVQTLSYMWISRLGDLVV